MTEDYDIAENNGQNEENTPRETVAPLDGAVVRRQMRAGYNRVGWMVFALVMTTLVLMVVLASVIAVLDVAGMPATAFFNRYMLLFNEAIIAIGVGVGALTLLGSKKQVPEKKSFPFSKLLLLFVMCFGMMLLGNIVSGILSAILQATAGQSVDNIIGDVLTDADPLMTLLMAGILGPILEELVFRKFFLDRTACYGEKTAIVVSALLFGLFHENFNQFFYAFGIGLLLAYLYCRTGKIWLCIGLHMAVNLISGVLGSYLTQKALPAIEKISELNMEEIATALPSLLSEYGGALFAYGMFAFVLFVLEIVGAVFAIIRLVKYRQPKSELPLGGGDRANASLLNAGVIVSVLLLLGLTIASLFVR